MCVCGGGGGGGWVKMLAKMAHKEKFKKYWLNALKQPPPKKKSKKNQRNLGQNVNDLKSNIWNSFFENISLAIYHTAFLYSSTQWKPFLTLAIFQQTCFCLVSEKTHCTISWRPRTACFRLFESECLYISVYLRKKMFVPETL